MKALFLLIGFFFLLGCTDYSGFETINVDWRERSYKIIVPENFQEKMPLVFVLHGAGGDALNAEQMSGMTDKANELGFIVVYPNGTGLFDSLSWNGGNCCGYARNTNVNDVKFFEKLIEKIVGEYNVDENKIYFSGFSNGGFMSHKMACELSGKIAGIASVGGAMGVENCNPAHPVPVIIIHGTKDDVIPYYGGHGEGVVGEIRNDYSAKHGFELWKNNNSCVSFEQKDYENIIFERYYNCENKSEVVLYTINNYGHNWPRLIKYDGSYFSATEIILDFFFSERILLN